jgi:translation elongation factor EF-1alpha
MDFGFSIAGDVATAAILGIDQNALRYLSLVAIVVNLTRAGDVICHTDKPIPVCSEFMARVITFEVARPLIRGSSVSRYLVSKR